MSSLPRRFHTSFKTQMLPYQRYFDGKHFNSSAARISKATLWPNWLFQFTQLHLFMLLCKKRLENGISRPKASALKKQFPSLRIYSLSSITYFCTMNGCIHCGSVKMKLPGWMLERSNWASHLQTVCGKKFNRNLQWTSSKHERTQFLAAVTYLYPHCGYTPNPPFSRSINTNFVLPSLV